MKKLIVGITLILLTFTLKIAFVIFVLHLCGVEFEGVIGDWIELLKGVKR